MHFLYKIKKFVWAVTAAHFKVDVNKYVYSLICYFWAEEEECKYAASYTTWCL